MAFYMIGFVLSVYMGLDTIVIAVIGFIIAWVLCAGAQRRVRAVKEGTKWKNR